MSQANSLRPAPLERSAPAAAMQLAPAGEVTISTAEPPVAATIPPARLALLAAVLAAIGAVFWPSLSAMSTIWEVDPNYSHGWVVPFFAIGLGVVAWRRKQVAPISAAASAGDVAFGLVKIALGVALHVAGLFFGNYLVGVLGMVCVLRGALLALGGPAASQAYALPALFLIFMAPLPASWYQPIAIVMQQWVSIVSTQLLELIGVPAYREGYFVTLPGYVMEVGEACSGLRQLLAILALAVGVGFLSGRSRGYCLLLTALAAPIAIAANCVRVFGTGIILILWGPKWAEGVYHTLEGMVIVALAAVFLLLTAWALGALQDRLRGAREATPA